jgi:alpha-tubulin suppressor-like RCC1 family protein
MSPRSCLAPSALLLAALACRDDTQPPSDSAGTLEPQLVTAAALTFRRVSVNWEHSCGLTTGNRAFCWGSNLHGELGAGTAWPEQPRNLFPIAVVGGLSFRQVSAGYLHSCGVTIDYLAYCWGSNEFGQLGRGTAGFEPGSSPRQVAGGLKFLQVSAGSAHSCGVSYPAQRVYCWGMNDAGQLGNGTGASQTAPVRVTGDHRFSEVSTGQSHTCGVTLTHEIFCWGRNEWGEVGDSTRTTRLRPVRVAGLHHWREVDAGGYHTCAVTTTSVAYCWGYGQSGQLGRGNRFVSLWPRRVAGALKFASIEAGEYHTCGVTTQSRAYCWGLDGSGQLGLGGGAGDFDRLLPEAVVGGLVFRRVSAALDHTCGVTAAGAAYCWGYNGQGQLGTGTRYDIQESPVPVSGPQ